MTLTHRFAALLFAALFGFLAGCTSTPKQEGVGEYVDDSVITTKVKVAIFDEPTLKSYEISVVTFKGVVQLSGFVGSQAQIDKAVELVRKVPGVKDVKNSMVIKGTQ